MGRPIGLQQRDMPNSGPEAARAARVDREEAIIARGEADIDAGRGIEDDAVEAWLDELDRNPDAPLPSPGNNPAL